MSVQVKRLFTPGPITTSLAVKQAAAFDKGSRDDEFIQTISEIRTKLLHLAKVSQETGYECILMQGSGTFSIESVVSSVVPEDGKILLVINGSYGMRFIDMCKSYNLDYVALIFDDNSLPELNEIEKFLKEERFTHLAVVHCETTTGMINPIKEIGELCKTYGVSQILDSMSAFGGIDFDMKECNVDYLVSSANKCIQGVPGFALILARREALEATKDINRSFCLHLYDQWLYFEKTGQFRFTPPVQPLLSFRQALAELDQEGGLMGRVSRYTKNYLILTVNMAKLGFKEYIAKELQGHTLVCYYYPEHPNFNFKKMYEKLSERGFLIFPGKLTKADTFRIGCIGNIHPKDMQEFCDNMTDIMKQMGVV